MLDKMFEGKEAQHLRLSLYLMTVLLLVLFTWIFRINFLRLLLMNIVFFWTIAEMSLGIKRFPNKYQWLNSKKAIPYWIGWVIQSLAIFL